MNRKDYSGVLFSAEKSNGKRKFTAVISTDVVDRDKDVLIPEGCVTKDYELNPVILWNHDSDLPPVGKATSIKREKGKLIASAELAEGTELADTLYKLMEQGILRGVSVGFDVRSGGERKPSKQDKEMYGPDVERVFNKWDLIEFSLVTLPANQEAMIMSVGKCLKAGTITKSGITAVFGDTFIAEIPEEVKIEEKVEEKKVIKEKRKYNLVKIPQKKKQKKVVKKVIKKKQFNIDKIMREELAKMKGRIFLD